MGGQSSACGCSNGGAGDADVSKVVEDMRATTTAAERLALRGKSDRTRGSMPRQTVWFEDEPRPGEPAAIATPASAATSTGWGCCNGVATTCCARVPSVVEDMPRNTIANPDDRDSRFREGAAAKVSYPDIDTLDRRYIDSDSSEEEATAAVPSDKPKSRSKRWIKRL